MQRRVAAKSIHRSRPMDKKESHVLQMLLSTHMWKLESPRAEILPGNNQLGFSVRDDTD